MVQFYLIYVVLNIFNIGGLLLMAKKHKNIMLDAELRERIEWTLSGAKHHDISCDNFNNFEVLQKTLDAIDNGELLSNGDIAECLTVIDGVDSRVSDMDYIDYLNS